MSSTPSTAAVFVDANVFLRFLTRDDQMQGDRAAALFRAAAGGELPLITGPPVLFEVFWSLRRSYAVPRERALDIVVAILAMPGLELLDRDRLLAAVLRARTTGAELADAYIVVSAEAAGVAVATFNARDFVKLGAPLHHWEAA